MADYNQLNKAQPSKLDMIFVKNKDINNAILILVRTAYLNHHQETKERNKKLVQCLEKDAKIIIDQLGDESFKENIKNKIQTIIDNDIGFSKETKEQIKTDIINTISTKIVVKKEKPTQIVRKTVTKQKDINSILNNKNFMSNLTKFTEKIINKNNKNRIVKLSKSFDSYIKIDKIKKQKIGQNRTNLVKTITSGFGNLVQDFIQDKMREDDRKSFLKSLQEKISANITRTIKYIKNIRDKIKSGISSLRKNLSPSNILKMSAILLFGVVKLLNKIIIGMFKGIFSLVKGIFKLGFRIIKGTFTIVKTTIKSIFKISKFIFKNLSKLTVGFLKRIKNFILTPTGMYITGFIVGWISTKIINKYKEVKEVKEDIGEIKKDLQLKFHSMRMSIFKELGENKYIKRLHETIILKNRFSSLQIYMLKITRSIRKFSLTGTLVGLTSGPIGAWVGRLIGTSIGGFFEGPLGMILGAGIGTALGYIAGKYIGEWFQTVPEKTDAETQKERNLIVSSITNKYREKKQRKIENKRRKLKAKIKELDSKIENKDKHYSDEQVEKFKKERSSYTETLKAFSGKITINDESEEERYKNEKVIQNLTDMLMREDEEFINKKDGLFENVSGSIFTGYKGNEINYNLDVNEVFENARKGDIDINLFPVIDKDNKREMNARNALRVLAILKVNAIQTALDAYQKGRISFSDIQPTANQLLQTSLNSGYVQIANKFMSVNEYLKNHIYLTVKGYGTMSSDGVLSQNDFLSSSMEDMQQQINRQEELTDIQEDLIDELTDRYVEEYKKIGNGDLIEEHRDSIRKMFESFVRENGIRNKKTLKSNQQKLLDVTQKISNLISIESEKVEFEEEQIPLVDKLLIGFRNSLILEDQMPKELNEEYKKESTEQLKKLNIIEKEKKEEEVSLEKARGRNSEAKTRYKELTQKVIELQGGLKLTEYPVPVPVEKQDNVPDYLKANKNSGIKNQDYNTDVSPIGSRYLNETNYTNPYGL